jgi:hypothetical protein
VKRIAAVAALIVAMLAVPAAAAMASTSTSGSGHAGHSQFFCQPNPFQHRYHHNRHNRRNHGHHGHHRHHRGHGFAFNNCNFPPPPPQGFCHGASFTFSWVSGADGIYEISGPALYTGEQFSYNGGLYTIVLANTLAGSMTLNAVNYGPTIFSATANLC